MLTRAQETNLRLFSVRTISSKGRRLTDPYRRNLRPFHLSTRVAVRAHCIPLRLQVSRTAILPENSALHLLRRRRADDANQARHIHAIPLLKFYCSFSVSLVGIMPCPTQGQGFSPGTTCALPRSSPIRFRRMGVTRVSRYRRTCGRSGTGGLVSVRGRAPAHTNWRADAAGVLVVLGRDCAGYLGAWWATGVSVRLSIGYLQMVPMNAVVSFEVIRCGCASLFHIVGFLYSVSSKHRHSGDYDAIGRIGPPTRMVLHLHSTCGQCCVLYQASSDCGNPAAPSPDALHFIQSIQRRRPSGRAIRPGCLPHLPQVLARPSKSRALARRRTPQQRRGRPNDHRYAPHTFLPLLSSFSLHTRARALSLLRRATMHDQPALSPSPPGHSQHRLKDYPTANALPLQLPIHIHTLHASLVRMRTRHPRSHTRTTTRPSARDMRSRTAPEATTRHRASRS
jgi:hypothetical protein